MRMERMETGISEISAALAEFEAAASRLECASRAVLEGVQVEQLYRRVNDLRRTITHLEAENRRLKQARREDADMLEEALVELRTLVAAE